jgi:hypothetical protein
MVFVLDRAGGAEVLKVIAMAEIAAKTEQIAASVGESAVIEMKTTDRARGVITVPADIQAKDGALSRAAIEAGLEFTAYKKREPRKRRRTRKEPSADTAATSTSEKPRRRKKKPSA